MSEPSDRTPTRRRVLGAAAAFAAPLVGLGSLVANSTAPGRSLAATRQDSDRSIGLLTMPEWLVIVHAIQDPYQGQLAQPEEPDPASRYVAVEIELRNASRQSWFNGLWQFAVRDDEAREYVGGNAVGTDPRLFDVELRPGESTRGWIYFAVPLDAQLTDLLYYPRLSLPWPESQHGPSGTPDPDAND